LEDETEPSLFSVASRLDVRNRVNTGPRLKADDCIRFIEFSIIGLRSSITLALSSNLPAASYVYLTVYAIIKLIDLLFVYGYIVIFKSYDVLIVNSVG